MGKGDREGRCCGVEWSGGVTEGEERRQEKLVSSSASSTEEAEQAIDGRLC